MKKSLRNKAGFRRVSESEVYEYQSYKQSNRAAGRISVVTIIRSGGDVDKILLVFYNCFAWFHEDFCHFYHPPGRQDHHKLDVK